MGQRRLLWVPGIRALRILWRLLLPLSVGAYIILVAKLFALPQELQQQTFTVFYILIGYVLLWALIHELFAPLCPQLRLVPISDIRARRLVILIKWLLLLLLGGELVVFLLVQNHAHPSLPALIRLVLELGLILVTWLVLQRSGMLDRLIPQEVNNSWSLLLSWAIRVILPLGVLTMLVFVALRAFGYIGFAQWLLERVAWTVVAVFLIVLIHWWIKRWIGRAMRFMQRVEVETRQEHGIAHDESTGWIAVDRILRLCLGIVAIAMLGFLVLHIWGIGPQDLGALLARQIAPGSQRTWMDLIKGALQVSVVLVAGRMLHDYLVFAYFPRKKTEVGVRYGAVKLLKLVVILIAVLVGFSAIGLNMSAMTVFAGGAGVGLSFALKDILGNFFSGLILLFGEAVRVDDIIEVGGVVGKVEAIRLRATVIRALDGNAVVIPNQQMIGERLTNKTKGMKIARLEVPVGVSYGSDLEVVEQVLLREARRMVGVLTEPGAFVRLTGFGDSSVDFQLFCYTDWTDDRYQLQHELRKRVFVAFRRKNIQIPFPQRDLHLDSVTSSATD